jgi:hypothetical protein
MESANASLVGTQITSLPLWPTEGLYFSSPSLGESVPCANEVAIDILATSDAAVKARRKRMNNLLNKMLKAKKTKESL